MAERLGRGRQHAMRLYAEWFREGSIDGVWKGVEPQAVRLVEEMVALTDFSLPGMAGEKGEGETKKFLLRFADGLESESVLIPMESGTTLCLSSQVGCRMGCAFCETGRMGLIRHLKREEIVAQVFYARFGLRAPVRNIVFMGMGEPFDNYDEVMGSVRILTDAAGLGFGPSRITISTSGRVDGIYRMIEDADPALNLAVSVNAPSDEVRTKIMPVNRKWNMAELKKAMLAYCAHPRREIFAEYVLMQGVNDSLEQADMLADYLEGLRVRVNLIPYNPRSKEAIAKRLSPEKLMILSSAASGCGDTRRSGGPSQCKAGEATSVANWEAAAVHSTSSTPRGLGEGNECKWTQKGDFTGQSSFAIASKDRFAPPDEEARRNFLQRMRERGYQTMLRGTKGQKIMAACGQLGNVEIRKRKL